MTAKDHDKNFQGKPASSFGKIVYKSANHADTSLLI